MPIYNMRLAGYLMQRGFVLQDVRDNNKCPQKKVFIFTDSTEIQQAVQYYLKQRKEHDTTNVTTKSK